MRRLTFALILTAVAVCSCGKSTQDQVAAAVGGFDSAQLGEKSVQVENLKASGDFATAEVTVRTAVKLRKKEGVWHLEEIRLGDRRWEKAEHLLALLNAQRAETGRRHLNLIAQGLQRYRQEHSRHPQAVDFRALIDLLTPKYMAQVIRFDPWSRPYRYQVKGGGFDLRSAGPDGIFDSGDDLVAENTP
ncbi:MAG TPA: type II secretion system protein GspG [Acidobacteriota bacterium]|nr:type II secretion system protein GspG [Acidobacteriota bacterium]